MSGRRSRQFREAKERLATIAACSCGHWPHDPGCVFLRYIAAVKHWCTQCGYRIQRRRSGAMSRWWCPNGCGHGFEIEASRPVRPWWRDPPNDGSHPLRMRDIDMDRFFRVEPVPSDEPPALITELGLRTNGLTKYCVGD